MVTRVFVWGSVMAFRSFVLQLIFRVLLVSVALLAGFAAVEASAQQSSQQQQAQQQQQSQAATDSFLVRFLGNFFNDSQDIPNSPWPYNSEPPSELRTFPAPQNSPPFPYADFQIGRTPTSGDRNGHTCYPLMKALSDRPNAHRRKQY